MAVEYSVGDKIAFTGPLGEKGLTGTITALKPLPPIYVVKPTNIYKRVKRDNYGQVESVETQETLNIYLREITGKAGGRRRKTKKSSKRRTRKTRRRHK